MSKKRKKMVLAKIANMAIAVTLRSGKYAKKGEVFCESLLNALGREYKRVSAM